MSKWMRKATLLLSAFLIVILLAACNLPGFGVEPVDAIPSPQPTIPLEDAGSDSCLVQSAGWFMARGDLDLLIGTLIPLPNVRLIDGALAIVFNPEGTFDYSGSMQLQIDLKPGEYIEGDGVFTNQGAYTTNGDTITFSESVSQSGILRWHAYANGQSIDMPGEGPTFSLIPSGAAPYRCVPGRLEIDTRTPSGGIATMFFY